jgi:hypothetical protein
VYTMNRSAMTASTRPVFVLRKLAKALPPAIAPLV